MNAGLKDNTFVIINHSFSAVRVHHSTLSSVDFKIKLSCSPNSSCSSTVDGALRLASVSYQVLGLWINNMLNDLIIVNPASEIGQMLIYSADNKFMFTPTEPDDNILARVLHSKVRAITKGNLDIGSLILQSSDTNNTERYWEGTDYMLPSIKYIEKPTLYDSPWWGRPTIDICEMFKEDITDEEVIELMGLADPLLSYEKELLDNDDSNDAEDSEAEIIDHIWKK